MDVPKDNKLQDYLWMITKCFLFLKNTILSSVFFLCHSIWAIKKVYRSSVTILVKTFVPLLPLLFASVAFWQFVGSVMWIQALKLSRLPLSTLLPPSLSLSSLLHQRFSHSHSPCSFFWPSTLAS
jgi:hypothetical protein